MNNFIDKHKKIILLIISIGVVLTVLVNSTYSLLFKEDVTELQSYNTGVLQLTSNRINNSVTLTNSLPMSDDMGLKSTSYDFKITNTGNLTFKFDVKLLSTDISNQIDSQYIKISVNGEETKTLNSLTEGKILENIILDSGKNMDISLRVWLADNTPNNQIGKVFNAKIVTEGYAIYTEDSLLPNIDYVTPDISDFTYYTKDTDPGYAYYMEEEQVLLASYNGSYENIRIPNTYTIDNVTYDTLLLVDTDTAPAGEVGTFVNNTNVKNVYIEEKVSTSYVSGSDGTTSGFSMFYGCSNLETVLTGLKEQSSYMEALASALALIDDYDSNKRSEESYQRTINSLDSSSSTYQRDVNYYSSMRNSARDTKNQLKQEINKNDEAEFIEKFF